MTDKNRTYGPGGIVWSTDGVATVPEIVNTFNQLEYTEIVGHNWRTCADQKCQAQWNVTDDTYIVGVMMVLDFDYRMGYLLQAVDKESGICTYIAVNRYYGRHADGSIEHDYMVWPGPTHRFGEREDGFDEQDICRWAVSTIYTMVDSHDEAERVSGDG